MTEGPEETKEREFVGRRRLREKEREGNEGDEERGRRGGLRGRWRRDEYELLYPASFSAF